jgi:hypothetical protein
MFYNGRPHFSSLDVVGSCCLGIVVVVVVLVVVEVPKKAFTDESN